MYKNIENDVIISKHEKNVLKEKKYKPLQITCS